MTYQFVSRQRACTESKSSNVMSSCVVSPCTDPVLPLAIVVDDRMDVWDDQEQAQVLQVMPWMYYRDEGLRKQGTNVMTAKLSEMELLRVMNSIKTIRGNIYHNIDLYVKPYYDQLVREGFPAPRLGTPDHPGRILSAVPFIKSVATELKVSQEKSHASFHTVLTISSSLSKQSNTVVLKFLREILAPEHLMCTHLVVAFIIAVQDPDFVSVYGMPRVTSGTGSTPPLEEQAAGAAYAPLAAQPAPSGTTTGTAVTGGGTAAAAAAGGVSLKPKDPRGSSRPPTGRGVGPVRCPLMYTVDVHSYVTSCASCPDVQRDAPSFPLCCRSVYMWQATKPAGCLQTPTTGMLL